MQKDSSSGSEIDKSEIDPTKGGGTGEKSQKEIENIGAFRRKLSRIFEKSNEQYGELNVKMDKKFGQIDKDIEKQGEEIDKVKNNAISNYIAVFGIFASIVAFLLVEVLILKEICSVSRVLSFSLIFAAVLLTFNLVLLSTINSKINNVKTLMFFIVAIYITGFLVPFLPFFGNESEYVCLKKQIDKDFETVILETVEKKVFEDRRFQELEFKLEQLEASFATEVKK